MLRSLEPPPPIGRIWRIENRQKWIRIEKVTAPQTRGSQELKKLEGVKNSTKTNHQTLQRLFPITQKVGYICILNHGWVYKHLTEGLSFNYENKMYIILYD